MFNIGKNKEVKISTLSFSQQTDGQSSKSDSSDLSLEQFLDELRYLKERFGKLVIDNVTSNNEIYMTSLESKKYEFENDKLDEITDLVKDYIEENAIKMSAFAVLVNDEIKEIYTKEINARACVFRLIREGDYDSMMINIKPIEIK